MQHHSEQAEKLLHCKMSKASATQPGGGSKRRRGSKSSTVRKNSSTTRSTPISTRARRQPARIDKILNDLYFSPEKPSSFGSPFRLFKAASEVNSKISLEDVEKWLSKQPAYTLHRDLRTKFPRRKVIVNGMRIQYQADLLDISPISRENDRNRYLLTVIDCFSRLATAIPIKSKQATVVAPALGIAFQQLGGSPIKLQTDDGTEFKAQFTQDYLKNKLGVQKWFASFQDVKAQIVERFNRTLRAKLQKYFAASKSLRYIETLPKILKGYNDTVHSSLKDFSPSQVNQHNQDKVFETQYRKYLNEKRKRQKFKIHDIVRISAYRATFFKKGTKNNFTVHLFVVTDVDGRTNPPTYRLKSLEDSEAIEGMFYESELQKVAEHDE